MQLFIDMRFGEGSILEKQVVMVAQGSAGEVEELARGLEHVARAWEKSPKGKGRRLEVAEPGVKSMEPQMDADGRRFLDGMICCLEQKIVAETCPPAAP